MPKKILISCVFIGVIAATITAFCLGENNSRGYMREDGSRSANVIIDKDMAVRMGSVILEKYFPTVFKERQMIIEAEENKEEWKVFNVMDRTTSNLADETIVTNGGGYYVILGKKSGEVIEIGIND
ncbi:hypothetical protein [Paenibacillus sp. MMS18-CY102]|uniref:hypothetical protein n=1 Tax=Paenibacillus sp. MMS18-CY102 TaxID=2682849 RepID=UPI0013652EFC|nr:hypothetical protein [Paenibacillus sp. MMS18-CY102]MWC26984.1 hypothetical protein [Paenibacillus sp. MMS18-CY102]